MKRKFSVQGHRGARGLFPENTLAGFANAVALGVDTIELDVAVTKDKVAVVSHDPRLNPDITRYPLCAWLDGDGPAINTMTVAELHGYDVGRIRPGTAYAAAFPAQLPQDAGIPTLSDVFALGGQMRFAVELKTFPDRPGLTVSPEEMANCVLAAADAARVTARILVQSFDWRGLRYLRRVAPDVALGWLTLEQPDDSRRLWWDGVCAADFGGSVAAAVAAEGGRVWIPQFKELDEAGVATAHAAGLQVIPWDVAPETELSRLAALGVDGVITDRPDIVLASIRAESG
jgi:glycerophosphoryl diester phosphodiesterase